MEQIIQNNASKMYDMVLNTLHMIMHCTWTSHIIACHAPIMDNPENNQHFNVLIYVGGGGLRISTLCTIEKMLTIVNDPLVIQYFWSGAMSSDSWYFFISSCYPSIFFFIFPKLLTPANSAQMWLRSRLKQWPNHSSLLFFRKV